MGNFHHLKSRFVEISRKSYIFQGGNIRVIYIGCPTPYVYYLIKNKGYRSKTYTLYFIKTSLKNKDMLFMMWGYRYGSAGLFLPIEG